MVRNDLLCHITNAASPVLQDTAWVSMVVTDEERCHCFHRLIEEKAPGSHAVEVSVVEIYNNDIRDLLSKDPNAKHDVVTGADGSLNFPTIICKYVAAV